MGRTGTWGHDLGDTQPELGVGGYTVFDKGRNRGFGWLDGPENTQSGAGVGYTGLWPSISNTSFFRGYVTIVKLPPSNAHRIIGQLNFVSSSDTVWYLSVTSAGKLRITTLDGFFATHIVTDSVLTLVVGTTYRWNVKVIFAGNGASTVQLKIDGDLAAGVNITTAGSVGSFNAYPGFGNTSVAVGSYKATLAEQQGGVIRIDDVVMDTAAEPVAGGITLLKVTGPGTYNTWNIAQDWHACVKAPPDTVNPMQNTGVSNAQTFTFETMASKGLAGVTIKSTRLCFYGSMARSGWKYRLRKNGVDFDSAASGGTLATNWGTSLSSFDTGRAWAQDAGTFALLPGDTIEGGVVDGPAGAGTSNLYGVYLLVEWEGADPTYAARSDAINIKTGSYVGNGSTQEIAFGDVTYVADAIMVIGDSNVGPRTRGLWFRGMGEDGQNGCDWTGRATGNVHRTYTNGFTVVGSAGDSLNASGITYRWLAISDGTKRMMNALLAQRNADLSKSTIDNIDIPLDDAAFPIEAMFSILPQFSGGAVSDSVGYTDTTYSADRTTMLDRNTAVPIADVIQSIGTGTFQVGTKCLNNSNADAAYAAFRTTQFKATRLLAYGSYVGNGGGARVVPLAFDGPGALVMVFSEAVAEPRYARFFNDGQGTTSRQLATGTTSTTAITDFSVGGQMSVNSALNTNLVVYHYIVFAAGVDAAIAPEVLLDDSGVGLTWVKLTDRVGTLHVWSKVALPDPLTYHGGYKEDRITQWGLLSRALSDRTGQMEALEFSWTAADTDRALRAMLAADATKYFRNRLAVAQMISDANRRLLRTPRTVIRGFVSDYRPDERLGFTFKAQDILSAKFAAIGQKPATVPSRLITAADFPNCAAEKLSLPVPFIYGNVTDTLLVTVPGPSAGVLPYDGTISNGDTYFVNSVPGTAGYQLGNPAGKPIYITLVPVRNGKGGPPVFAYGFQTISTESWVFGNPPDPLSTTGVALGFDPRMNTDAQSWRAFFADAPDFDPYGSKGSATKVRYIDHDISTYDNPFTSTKAGIVFTSWTDGTDAIGGAPTSVVVDQGKGAYPPILVGDYVMVDGVNRHKWLASGHANKAYDELYVGGIRLNLATDPTIAGVGGAFLVPGYPGYIAVLGAPTFEVINGHRYSCIYGTVGNALADQAAGVAPLTNDDTVPFAISVRGVETVGDSSGTLITDLHDQYLHILQNLIFRTYNTGAWLTTPAFEDDPTLLQIDEASIAAVKLIARQRITGGYVGAFVIGADGEILTFRDLIARLNQSSDVDSAWGRKCQFMLSMVDESIASLASATVITDVLHVFKDTFSVSDDLGSHANIIPTKYAQDYSHRNNSGWLGSIDNVRDTTSIANYASGDVSGEFTAPELDLFCVRDQPTAFDVAWRRLLRQKDPPRIVKFAIGNTGMNYEVGQVLSLTHYQGVGASGWVGNPVRIRRHDADPENFQVIIEGVDMQTLFAGAFVLGDESVLPGSWPAATTAQKQYGYLCDEPTGLFSNGEHGKRLR